MPLPAELLDVVEETTVVGDVDAFLYYLETGQAARDYETRLALRIKELIEAFG